MATNTVNYIEHTDLKNITIIDEFNKFEYKVDGAEYDVVSTFFKKMIANSSLASSFTTAIYQVAVYTNTSVIDLVRSLDGQTELELSISMAYYLNNIRSNSALLGIQNQLKPNYYAFRMVRL